MLRAYRFFWCDLDTGEEWQERCVFYPHQALDLVDIYKDNNIVSTCILDDETKDILYMNPFHVGRT